MQRMLRKRNFHRIVEQVVDSYTYFAKTKIFGIDDEKDVKQTIRVICWSKYKQADFRRKDKIYNFLKTCVHNELYNMQRGMLFPNNNPCNRCHLWNAKRRRCVIVNPEKICDRIIRYNNKLEFKRKIFLPKLLDLDEREDILCKIA